MLATGIIGLNLVECGRGNNATIAVILEYRIENNRFAWTITASIGFDVDRYRSRCAKPATKCFTAVIANGRLDKF